VDTLVKRSVICQANASRVKRNYSKRDVGKGVERKEQHAATAAKRDAIPANLVLSNHVKPRSEYTASVTTAGSRRYASRLLTSQ